MAWARQSGRPYTVSEYNQPWPNTHGAEIDPSLAAFGAFQDWDGIMHFAYSHGRNWDDGVPNGFNVNGDWTKFPVIGQSAWLFRTSVVQSAADSLEIPVTAADRLQSASAGQSITTWVMNRAGVPKEVAFTRRVGLAKDDPGTVSQSAKLPPKAPYVTSTGQLQFDKDARLLLIDAPLAAGVLGAAGGTKVSAGPIDVELAASSRGFLALLMTALDNRPIAASARLLFSIPGYTLRALPAPGNRQPSASTAQPQTLVHYRGTTDWWTLDPTNSQNPGKPSGDMNGGWQPTYIERVEVWLTLRTNAASVGVSALDGTGEPVADLPATEIARVPGGFRIHVNGSGQPASPWFVISAVQPGAARNPPPRR